MQFNRSILLIIALGIFTCSCTYQKTGSSQLKTPGDVPQFFYNGADDAFTKVQDTIFYKGGRFSGYLYTLYDTRDTAQVIGYFNGLQEGITKKWYPNNQLMEERFYVHGGKEGTHKGWWDDGKPKFIYHFVNDEYEGPVTEWFNTGAMYRQFHYVKGYENGSEKMWWNDGSVRANYVVRDGQQYGLIGRKLCRNTIK